VYLVLGSEAPLKKICFSIRNVSGIIKILKDRRKFLQSELNHFKSTKSVTKSTSILYSAIIKIFVDVAPETDKWSEIVIFYVV